MHNGDIPSLNHVKQRNGCMRCSIMCAHASLSDMWVICKFHAYANEPDKTTNHLALELEKASQNTWRAEAITGNTPNLEYLEPPTKRPQHHDYAWTLHFIHINCTVTLCPHATIQLTNWIYRAIKWNFFKRKKNKGKGHRTTKYMHEQLGEE